MKNINTETRTNARTALILAMWGNQQGWHALNRILDPFGENPVTEIDNDEGEWHVHFANGKRIIL